jgi:peptidoglycan hydrolase CwlO-like protein
MKKVIAIILPLTLVCVVSCSKEKGCTDAAATNYMASAEEDDNSCLYDSTGTDSLNVEIDSVNTGTDSLETDIDSLNTNTDDFDTEIDSVNTGMDSLNTDVDSLNTD